MDQRGLPLMSSSHAPHNSIVTVGGSPPPRTVAVTLCAKLLGNIFARFPMQDARTANATIAHNPKHQRFPFRRSAACPVAAALSGSDLARPDPENLTMPEQVKALRARGFGRAALAEDTGDILLSFIDQNGDEQWLQLPLHSAGALAAGLIAAAGEAAKHAVSRTQTDITKTIQTGMSLKNYEFGISLDKTLAILAMHTTSGLTFDFPLAHEDLSQLRSDIHKIEAVLNRGKSQRSKRH